MATYRNVHTSFWQDSFVLDLTPEEKYFYLYLFTNSRTTQCGVYDLPLKVAEVETGYNRETVQKLIEKFISFGKVEYCSDTKEIFLINWLKYNSSKSPKVLTCIKKELENVKSTRFKKYCMDSLSIDLGEEEEKEQEEEEEKEQEEKGDGDFFDMKKLNAMAVKYLGWNPVMTAGRADQLRELTSVFKSDVERGFVAASAADAKSIYYVIKVAQSKDKSKGALSDEDKRNMNAFLGEEVYQ